MLVILFPANQCVATHHYGNAVQFLPDPAFVYEPWEYVTGRNTIRDRMYVFFTHQR